MGHTCQPCIDYTNSRSVFVPPPILRQCDEEGRKEVGACVFVFYMYMHENVMYAQMCV